jgi:hypothetical protein
MTKYEELLHELAEHADFVNQQAIAAQFAGRFAAGLRAYLGWPEKGIRYARPSGKYTTLKDYYETAEEAIGLPETSFLWTLDIELLLEQTGSAVRGEKHNVRLQMRKKYDHLLVFCAAEHPWKISLAVPDAELVPIYEKIYADLLRTYRDFSYKSTRSEAAAK